MEGGSRANFGDGLNAWIWEELLPGCWDDPDDDTLFCGIGTIIGRSFLPRASKYIVFSSGTGYEAPHGDFGSDRWKVHCVRGKLTAHVLGMPETKAISDGALLLSLLPRYRPLPESQRSGVVFMAHIEAHEAGNWKAAAERAGITFLDPLVESRDTVEQIRRAKLVLADAMHAAIVADTLRVPWVPLVTSKQINTFKWLDWTLSVDVPYRPIRLPASGLMEALRNSGLGLYGNDFTLKENTFTAAIEHYERSSQRTRNLWWGPYVKWTRRSTYNIPNRMSRMPLFERWLKDRDERFIDSAAEALRKATQATSYLSNDTVFAGQVDKLWDCLLSVPEIACQRV